MKVKAFEQTVVLDRDGANRGLAGIEEKINAWLETAGKIRIEETKLSCCASPFEHAPTHFVALCLVFFTELR